MSDRTLRASQRTEEGVSLAQLYRAGELWPAYTTAREVACGECDAGTAYHRKLDGQTWASGFVTTAGSRCGACSGTGRVPFNALDLVRLLAFLDMDGEAGDLVADMGECLWCGWVDEDGEDQGGCCVGCVNLDPGSPTRDLGEWVNRLQRLCAKLPPHRLLVNSVRRLVYALDRRKDSGLVETKTNWPHDTPAERWMLVVAACAAGWECATKREKERRDAFVLEGVRGLPRLPMVEIERAIDACQAWIAEPTHERLAAWGDSTTADMPDWIPLDTDDSSELADAIQAAARVISPERVREVSSAAILNRLLNQAKE